MAHNAGNFTIPQLVLPDAGDQNNVASTQVSGGTVNVGDSLDGHDHTLGLGKAVDFAGLAATSPLQMDRPDHSGVGTAQGVGNAGYVQFKPVADTTVPNNSLFVDQSDNLLKYRDNTSTIRTVDLT